MTQSFLTNQNFLVSDLVFSSTASSEKENFENGNLYNSYQRSRTWRSNGYFSVGSTNKTIIFRETNAVDLTATLVEDNYSSSDLLAAAIKTALDSAGSSVYTVEIDATNGKWKITSDGAGGGGIFEIIWTDPLSDFGETIGFDTSSDDTGLLEYTADTIAIHTEEFIEWDLGTPSNPQSFFIFGASNRSIQLTSNSTIKLEANTTNTWTAPAYSQELTYSDTVIFIHNQNGLTSPYRYWRLQIVDKDNSNGFVEIGAVFLGSNLYTERGRIQFGFRTGKQDFVELTRSLGGQVYGSSRAKNDIYSAAWAGCTSADKELIDDHFESKGTDVPFVIVADPNTAATTDQSRLTRIVRYASPPSFSILTPNYWNGQFQVEEAL